MSSRPWITCHVLDTTSGKPAPGIPVELKLLKCSDMNNLDKHVYRSQTNADGRVLGWTSDADMNTLVAVLKARGAKEGQMVWSLTFDTEAYFGSGKTFWPEVELRIAASADEEHYHVPLLLGPWSYTTYRGS